MLIKTDKLTNTEILQASPSLLTSMQKQVRFVMSQHLQQKPCPNCGELHNVPEAAGYMFDEYDFSAHHSDRTGPCRRCGRTLIFVLPIMGGWRWQLDPKEASVGVINGLIP